MRVNEAVVDRLAANDITAVFGIPGTQTLPLNEAIEARAGMRFVMARHETAITHQAWGYAESTGRPAATVVVPGPGDLNAMNGLKNALNDCTPLVHFSVETEAALRGGDAIHETPPETYDTVVKTNDLLAAPERAAAAVDRAIAIAETPPKGPVRIGLPKDLLGLDVPQAAVESYDRESVRGVPARAVAAAADRLAEAARPVVIAGGGVRTAGAGAELAAVADRVAAPIATTYKGKGTVSEDDPRAVGVLGGAASEPLLDLLAAADVGLVVGSDLDAVSTHGFDIDLPSTLIHVTVDPDDIGTGYDPAIGIVADAKATLAALDRRLGERDVRREQEPARAERVREAVRDRTADLREAIEPPLPSAAALAALRRALPAEAVVSIDAGGFRLWALATFPVPSARSIVTPGSWATMGTGLPGAIGAAVADPDRPVVALTGDGGLLMCLHELHTIAVEDIPVLVVVLNNDDYAIISDEAVAEYALEGYGWPERSVAFSTVAAGVGLDATQADTPSSIESAVGAALETGRPHLLEIPTDPDEPQVRERLRG